MVFFLKSKYVFNFNVRNLLIPVFSSFQFVYGRNNCLIRKTDNHKFPFFCLKEKYISWNFLAKNSLRNKNRTCINFSYQSLLILNSKWINWKAHRHIKSKLLFHLSGSELTEIRVKCFAKICIDGHRLILVRTQASWIYIFIQNV